MNRLFRFLFSWRLLFSFLLLLIPDMVGYFALLRSYEVHPLVAVGASIGLEFGGAPLTIYNSLMALPKAGGIESVWIIFAIFPAFLSMAAFFIFWIKISTVVEGRNISKFWIWITGIIVFTLLFIIALLTELYILPMDAPRVGGLAYAFSNLEMAFKPVVDLVQTNVIQQGGTENATEALNTTSGNSSVRR